MIDDLLKKLGGASAVAAWLSQHSGQACSSTSVRQWSLDDRNRVPWRWRALVAAMAHEKGVDLSGFQETLTLFPRSAPRPTAAE